MGTPKILEEWNGETGCAVTDRDALAVPKVDSGPITVYSGFDPTATEPARRTPHPDVTLRRFHRLGHRPIVWQRFATA